VAGDSEYPDAFDRDLSTKALRAGSDILAEADRQLEDSIQDLALGHAPDAIDTLAKFSKGQKVGGVEPTAHVVRSSARDIVEFAGGRPETRDPRVADGSQHLTIVLERKSDGELRRFEHASEGDFKEIIDGAEKLIEAVLPRKSVKKTFDMPDIPVPVPDEGARRPERVRPVTPEDAFEFDD